MQVGGKFLSHNRRDYARWRAPYNARIIANVRASEHAALLRLPAESTHSGIREIVELELCLLVWKWNGIAKKYTW